MSSAKRFGENNVENKSHEKEQKVEHSGTNVSRHLIRSVIQLEIWSFRDFYSHKKAIGNERLCNNELSFNW